jgi:hypothetical protein
MKNKLNCVLVVFLFVISSCTFVAGDKISFKIDINNQLIQPPETVEKFPGDFYEYAPSFDVSFESLYSQEKNLNDPEPLSFANLVQGMILQISESTVSNYISTLAGFGPRVTGSTACDNAGTYIYNVFQGMGLEVRYQYWSSGSYSGKNVEATIYGENTGSDEIYIVCGHYDSVPGSPGADDNAAGTAAVLAAAKVMSDFKFSHTVRFVAFDGEEQGLIGSSYYVEEAYNNEDNIVAALNADMIGYAESPDDASKIKIFHDGGSSWIMGYTDLVSQTYDEFIGLDIIDAGYASNSDHYRFWQYGYNAIMYHEYHFNPYYHSPQDTIDKMDLDYDMRVSRLIAATLAELAEPQESGNGGNGGHDYVFPIVGITYPTTGEVVNGTIEIQGYSYPAGGGFIKWVLVQIKGSDWEYADGLLEWTLTWDTTTVEDGETLISAVSIDSFGHQSGVKYVKPYVKNTPDPPPKIPNLYADGTFDWSEVEPGITLTENIIVKNIGDPESLLDWEVTSFPEWGIWTFMPENGFDLTPESSEITVYASVIIPEEEEQNYTGEIRIINTEDASDHEIIHVSVSTPKVRALRTIFTTFLENHPRIFPILRRIMGT